MSPLQNNIVEFLSKNQVASVCFVDEENKPYCINCFYCFDLKQGVLVFKSSFGAKHEDFVKTTHPLAGTVIADQNDITKLKGIQFSGSILNEQMIYESMLNLSYIKKFPLSIVKSGYLWGVQLEFVKFTNNTFGFGSKTVWKRDSN
jgi:uncharacterized protein YhbP (UPF0306 family)